MSQRSTSDIEREVEAKREEVEETLDALRAKLSPGQIIDMVARSLASAGGQGGEFMSNLGRQVKENPLPIAVTGIGLAWLLVSSQKSEKAEQLPAPIAPPDPPREGRATYDHGRFAADEESRGAGYAVAQLRSGAYDVNEREGAEAPEVYDRVRYEGDEAAHGVDYAVSRLKSGAYRLASDASNAAASAYDHAKFAADEAKFGARTAAMRLSEGAYALQNTAGPAGRGVYDRARLAADEASRGANYVSEQLKVGAYVASDAASAAYENARIAAGTAADDARYAGRRAQRTVADFIAEEPLIAGALGIALGAALGAVLPPTKREDELMGPHRDKLRDQALDYAAERAEEADRAAPRSPKQTRDGDEGKGGQADAALNDGQPDGNGRVA